MAFVCLILLMKGQGNGAVFTSDHLTAGRANRKTGKPPAVEKQQDLLSSCQRLLHRLMKLWRDKLPDPPLVPKLTQIHDQGFWKRPILDAPRQDQTVEFPGQHMMIRLNGRGCRTQQGDCAVHFCPDQRNVPCMVVKAAVLFV